MRTNTPTGAAAALILTAWVTLGLWPDQVQTQTLHVDGAPAMAEPLARAATAAPRHWRDDPAAASQPAALRGWGPDGPKLRWLIPKASRPSEPPWVVSMRLARERGGPDPAANGSSRLGVRITIGTQF